MAEAVTGSQQDVAGARLIAADVGGTYARIGLVEVSDTGSQLLLHHHRYPCAEFAGLAAILRRFREDCAAEQLGACPAVCVVAKYAARSWSASAWSRPGRALPVATPSATSPRAASRSSAARAPG